MSSLGFLRILYGAGATISTVYLGGYSAAAIKPPSKLNVVAVNASQTAGRLKALFTLRLNSTANEVSQTPTAYIYAVGKLDPKGVIQQHDDTQVQNLS